MKTVTDKADDFYFLRGGGEMGARMRTTDWSRTPLGDPDTWPQSLRTMVAVMLQNPFGMYIAWGTDFTQLYNDACRSMLGSLKHPQALGIPARDTFSEIWNITGPMFDDAMKGTPVGSADFRLTLNRNGFTEDCYFDFAYSPIRTDNGEVGGVLVTVAETTHKKKAEEALKESEERFRTMADHIPNLAWMADADGYLFWYNKQWYDYTGTTEEAMKGWGWQSVHHPDELPKVIENWTTCISTGQPFEMIFPLKAADGTFRQFLTRVLPIRDEAGNITQWFGTNTDITDQIRAEQEVIESEHRLRGIVESAPFPIAVYAGADMNIQLANQTILDIWGKGNDVINKSYKDILPELNNQQIFEQVKGVMDTGIAYHARNERVDLMIDGKLQSYYFNYSFSPLLDRKGKVYGVMNTAAEITELTLAKLRVQESENNLRQTILQAPVAMCIFRGRQQVVELANERMFELWGKTAEELMYKPIFEGLPEARDQGFEAMLDGVFTTGNSFLAEGVPITLPRKKMIEKVFINFVCKAYREADGSISGVLVVALDVTAQVIAKQKIEEEVALRTSELASANNLLQKSNAELAQFAYIASHDLQEPLRKISNFTQMLENRVGNTIDDQSRQYITKINNASAKMHTLVRDVLTYSELVNEHNPFEEVDLNEIVKGVLMDYELLIEQKGATVHYQKLPVIQAIALQMSQLFGNLVGNALKFTHPERPCIITISYNEVSPEDIQRLSLNPALSYIHIVFRDTGIGFKEEYAEQIFHIFQRLHHTSEYEGTGIGLAMCKKIAVNHHGELNAKGSSENGAVFQVVLPVKQE